MKEYIVYVIDKHSKNVRYSWAMKAKELAKDKLKRLKNVYGTDDFDYKIAKITPSEFCVAS